MGKGHIGLEPNTERTTAIARSGGRAKAANQLTLTKVREQLPTLDSPENCQARLAVSSEWMAAGLMNGSASNAFVAAHRVWLDAYNASLDKQRMKQQAQRIKGLEAELAKEQRRAGMRGAA